MKKYYAVEYINRLNTDTCQWSRSVKYWSFESAERRNAICEAKPNVHPVLKKNIPTGNVNPAEIVECLSTVRIIPKVSDR